MPSIFQNVTMAPTATAPSQARVVLALLLVYIVWGTTYFGLSVALKTMPPWFMNGSRFLLAGTIMLGLARWHQQPWPTPREWLHSAGVGGLMVFVAMNLVGFAQHLGIGSGLMATVVATMPMWLTLWTRWGGESVPLSSWLGLGLGVLGALLLALEGDFSSTWQGGLLAFGAPLAWSIGSYLSRRIRLPQGQMAPAAQWLTGGTLSMGMAWVMEPIGTETLAHISWTSWLAWMYLVLMGTLVALNAYLWLLQHTSSTLAGSYSFVNPAVALMVGVIWGGEQLTGWIYVALPLIAMALALLMYGPACLAGWHAKIRHSTTNRDT